MNKLLNKQLEDKNIIFIIGNCATGKTELANQIENVDEIIEDFPMKIKPNMNGLITLQTKLSQAKESNKRYVVILTKEVIEEFSILKNHHIAWIFTRYVTPPNYNGVVPKNELIWHNFDFMRKSNADQDNRPYLICFDSNMGLVIEQGIFYKKSKSIKELENE